MSNAKKAIPQFYKACQFYASRLGKKYIIIILPWTVQSAHHYHQLIL